MGFYTDTDKVGQRLRTTFSSTTTPTLDVIDEMIDEVENEIDSYAGRSYRKRTVTAEYHDYSGSGFILTKNPGLSSVTTLQYTDDDGATWNTISASQYDLYSDFDMIEFKPELFIPKGNRVIRITYVAGPDVVPARISKLATSMACLEVIRSQVNSSGNTAGGEVQVGPIRVTEPGAFSVNLVRSLQSEIDATLTQLSSSRMKTTVTKRWDF
jgi:hypothetical protein